MCVPVCELSLAHLITTPWTVTHQTPPVHGISQARILAWVAISFFRAFFPTQGSNSHLLRLLCWQVGSLPVAPSVKPG